ncbi:glycosyltransferase [Labrys sp. 22185]|uniref:glycosyltransferase n=1 Tax=Labrys sp. 22185 TaxID=3453888 RepID=UPI003F8521C7
MNKVALISRGGGHAGGASRVADDLYFSLVKKTTFEARRFIGETIELGGDIPYQPIIEKNIKLYRSLKKRATRRGYVDHFPFEIIGLNAEIRRADIVHAHDISSVFSPSMLEQLSLHRTVVWTLHDMSPFTGGCIYPLGCNHWLDECGTCPQLCEWPLTTKKDRTSTLVKSRRRILAQDRLHLIAPSEWIRSQLQRVLPGASATIIYNGVDTKAFHPDGERHFMVPADPSMLTLLFVANMVNDVRKGGLYQHEIRSLLAVRGKKLRLVIVGGARPAGVKQDGPLTTIFAGRIQDRSELASIYRSVDAALIPSHADNFPLVILEAMACGTPVLAFDTGGISEQVDSDCGMICQPGDIKGLMDFGIDAFERGQLPGMGRSAREKTERSFSLDLFETSHEAFYQQLLRKEAGRKAPATAIYNQHDPDRP